MVQGLSRSRASVLLIQLLAIVGAVGEVAGAPPAHGRMLLVPLSAQATRGMVAMAVVGSAALIGPGALPGSLVIEGQRAALFQALINHGVALAAAPSMGCGR